MGLGGPFVYLFFVQPVTAYILKRKAWAERTRIIMAVSFLVAVAAVDVYPDLAARPPNYYEVLQVPVSATATEVRKAYRTMSLKHHPDKTAGDAEGSALFVAISEANEVLGDRSLRPVYDRYGLRGLEKLQHSPSDDISMSLMMDMGVFYAMWAVMTYILTMFRHGSPLSRSWAYAGFALLFAFELMCKFGNANPMAAALPFMTPYEKVELLQLLYPAFVSGCIVMASLRYVDPLIVLQAQMEETISGLRHLHLQLKSVEVKLAEMRRHPSAASTAEAKVTVDPALKRRQDVAAANRAKAIADQQKPAVPGWLVMVGLYVLFNYVLK